MHVDSFTSADGKHWDDFVSFSPFGHYMQSHAWGKLQEHHGWTPHYLEVRDGDALKGTALVLSRTIPVLGKKIMYAPRGPVFDFMDTIESRKIAVALQLKIQEIGGVFLRCDPYVSESVMLENKLEALGYNKVERDWSYWNGPKLVFWLDLRTDEDTLFKNMSSTCRNEVRAGYKKGVVFEQGCRDDLDDFYRLMVSTGQHKGIAVHDADYYRTLYDTLSRSASVGLFLGRFEGKTIAAGMSVKYGEKAWLLYAASNREYYKLKPNRTLQWEMVLWAHREGCHRYDFRGTAASDPPNPDDPGYGVYEFKKSFGPEYTRLVGYYDLVVGHNIHRLFRFSEEKVLPLAYRTKTWLDERKESLK